jgi:hypothetical protein
LKKKIHIFLIKSSFSFSFLVWSFIAYAQPTPGDLYGPPDLPTDTAGDTPMGGSAPLDDGLYFFLAFVLMYLAIKYQKRIFELFSNR